MRKLRVGIDSQHAAPIMARRRFDMATIDISLLAELVCATYGHTGRDEKKDSVADSPEIPPPHVGGYSFSRAVGFGVPASAG